MGLGIKKEDTVLVISGKDKGKRGRVLQVMPKDKTLLVEQVNMIKKHMKPNNQYKQGGIIDKENPIAVSNVMLVCPKCDKPTRVANTPLEDGRKLRSCKQCKEVLDQ